MCESLFGTGRNQGGVYIRKTILVVWTLVLILLLCACGEEAVSVKVELPAGLRFGISPEEVAEILGEKETSSAAGDVYFVDYGVRPEGFDPSGRLSGGMPALFVEYTDGKLSHVTLILTLSGRESQSAAAVVQNAITYYSGKLGEPIEQGQGLDATSGMRMWKDGKFSLSLIKMSTGNALYESNSIDLSFQYDYGK